MTDNSATVVLAIGRNLSDDSPLSDSEWSGFRRELFSCAEERGTILNFGDVVGTYLGVEEESYVVTFTTEQLDLATLDEELASLAQFFGQEAIGRIVHVPGNPVPGGWQPIGESVVAAAHEFRPYEP